MIRDVFIPAHIGNYYIFGTRILGIEINKTHIVACLTLKTGHKIIIEQLLDEPIEGGTGETYLERASQALTTLISRCEKKFDAIHSVFSSSTVIFKELRFPFSKYEKIRMVVNFEVEPLLPFSLNDASIDFIVTKTTPEYSVVLVAAAQKQQVLDHLALFDMAQVKRPSVLTVDFFVLYDLYRQAITDQEGGILIDIGLHATRIGIISQGYLRHVRTLSHGIIAIARSIAERTNTSATSATDQLLRLGLESTTSSAWQQATQEAFAPLWEKLSFTIKTLADATGLPAQTPVSLFGFATRISGIETVASQMLQYPCKILQPTTLIEKAGAAIATKNGLSSNHLICAGATLLSPLTKQFNLLREDLETSNKPLFVKQLAVGLALVCTIIGMLLANTIIELRTLNKKIDTATEQTLEALHNRFPIVDITETDLSEAIRTAQSTMEQEERTWFKFYNPARPSMLKYFYELTAIIDDKKTLGLDLESVNFSENMVTMQGKVKNYDALKLLERNISQSKVFRLVPPPPPEPVFSIKLQIISSLRGS